MKTTKLMFMVALVCAMLSFGAGKATAQPPSEVPVTLYSASYSIPNWASNTTWYVTMYNTATNTPYYRTTSGATVASDGSFQLGNIPPGTYTVTVSYYNPYVPEEYFDWYLNLDQGYSVHMWRDEDTTLNPTYTVTVDNDDTHPNTYGLQIFLFTAT